MIKEKLESIKKRELLGFLVGGSTAVAVDYSTYYLLMYVGLSISLSKAISYVLGATVGFVINKYWAFDDHIGFNYRMPNINAALGCAQLENLDKYITSKRQVAAEYAEYFKNVEGVEFFTEPENCFSNYWLNVVILKDKQAQLDFLTETNDNGVMTRPIWELMNRLPMFEKCDNDGLKNTIWFADRVVNIPSSVRPSDLPKE